MATTEATPALIYDYNERGISYSGHRTTEPAIARYINEALGEAQIIVNVGAGTGSYEPQGKHVVAVEPSATMRAQRRTDIAPAINAKAEALPFDDNSFDASMALLTIHHWSDVQQGLGELRRVTRGPVVVVTFDIPRLSDHWITTYGSELIESDLSRFPTIEAVCRMLGGSTIVDSVALPLDCKDGILEAYYGRPEAYLNKDIRSAQSIWGVINPLVEERIVSELATDLGSGEWDRKYGYLRTQPFYESSMRIITALP